MRRPGDPTIRCLLFGHAWVHEPIITLRDTRYCRRCGVRP